VWLRAGLGAALVAASVGAGTVALGPRSGALDTPASPRSIPIESTLLVAAHPPAPAPVLSTPSAPPADPYADVPVEQIGSIEIPRIGVARPIAEGIWLTVIDQGPGHWPGTAAPGGWGNTVIAAHRTTHGGPFRDIGELVSGDQIILRDAHGTYTYVVSGAEVVTPQALWITEQRPGRSITLFACHPIGSAAQRYVVHGELARTDPA
jgi:sortase A